MFIATTKQRLSRLTSSGCLVAAHGWATVSKCCSEVVFVIIHEIVQSARVQRGKPDHRHNLFFMYKIFIKKTS